VINLALNGADAMEQGGRLSISTGTASFEDALGGPHPGYRPGRFVQLTVTDNGCGMTPQTKAHLFEPFFTTKGPGKGTGLGLATVYGIVHESSGFITGRQRGRRRRDDERVPASARHSGARTARLPAIDSDVAKGHETVLLVEDEDSVRAVATRTLTMHGYRVMAAASGPAALRLPELAQETVHLLVTDVVMPEMSGGQLADDIRRRFPSCRVLFMSGYNEDMAIRHGQLGRNDAFLQKPFTPGSWRGKFATFSTNPAEEARRYLQRLAGGLGLRHLRWHPSHDALSVSAIAIILSWSLAWAAAYAFMLASRTSCTNFVQVGSFTGTGSPFEQRRPSTVNKVADSASASDAFSTACHPPNELVNGSVDMLGSWPGMNFTSAGLSAWAENTTLAAGYRTPRISWFILA
jgi:CheY-like chemotaxis protein